MGIQNISYMSDDNGEITAVIVPIDLWLEIGSAHDETKPPIQ